MKQTCVFFRKLTLLKSKIDRSISSCINLTQNVFSKAFINLDLFSDRIYSQSWLLPKTAHDLGLKTSQFKILTPLLDAR